jgi:hypothetical protein
MYEVPSNIKYSHYSYLSKTDIGDAGAILLGGCLKESNSLYSLNISNNDITSIGIKELSTKIGKCPLKIIGKAVIRLLPQ